MVFNMEPGCFTRLSLDMVVLELALDKYSEDWGVDSKLIRSEGLVSIRWPSR